MTSFYFTFTLSVLVPLLHFLIYTPQGRKDKFTFFVYLVRKFFFSDDVTYVGNGSLDGIISFLPFGQVRPSSSTTTDQKQTKPTKP